MKMTRLSLHRPHVIWRRHPAVRSGDELTVGERAADRLRNGMGSWAFVLGALVFLAGWMLGNRNIGFDPYPFILPNLVLSCVAALQGAFLLIAAQRSEQIAAELAAHDYDTDREAADGVHQLQVSAAEILRRLERPEVGGTADGPRGVEE